MPNSEQVEDIVERIERASAMLGPSNTNVGTSNINVDAGGVAVWIAATCCIVSIVVTLLLFVTFSFRDAEQNRKIDNLGEYLSAIYMAAPQLKPKEK
ncbi:hypothetical protein [Xanthomonas phage XAJ2]|uniref:Uncharacterized protein n=1 Tax=Xanthomonas phage XAJ2 TaxID=1775249 RepID=A0A1I9L2K4_9CAUD|nr:hypothetical protein [Xanthomonas phage XAJ2]